MKPILTIVISTYNRAGLLKRNISKMLESTSDRVKFLVCDNACTDNTWEILNEIKDQRVDKYRNEENLDINNTCLMSYRVETPFFEIVNDRDYIEPQVIDEILELLMHIEDKCQIITIFKSNRIKAGYYKGTEMYPMYYLANHPGRIIYNTKFFHTFLNRDMIEKLVYRHDSVQLLNYVTYQLMMNIEKGFYWSKDIIVQPANRDKIKQARKEHFGIAYILPEHQMSLLDTYVEYSQNYQNLERVRSLLLAMYIDGLKKTELEYAICVSSEKFRNRNNCTNERPGKWLNNGWRFTFHVLNNKIVMRYKMCSAIKRAYIYNTFANGYRIVKTYIKREQTK